MRQSLVSRHASDIEAKDEAGLNERLKRARAGVKPGGLSARTGNWGDGNQKLPCPSCLAFSPDVRVLGKSKNEIQITILSEVKIWKLNCSGSTRNSRA